MNFQCVKPTNVLIKNLNHRIFLNTNMPLGSYFVLVRKFRNDVANKTYFITC